MPISDPLINLAELFIKFGLPPVATLIAGYLGLWYGLRQVERAKKLDFIEKQLKEFYSPMLGIRKEIETKSNLRVRVSKASHEVYREKIKEGQPDYTVVKAEIEYNNEQFRDELFPLYKSMQTIFRDNYWLASKSTAAYYPKLVEYIEIWDRHFANAIEGEVVEKVNHTEAVLHPFYNELETMLWKLQRQLKKPNGSTEDPIP